MVAPERRKWQRWTPEQDRLLLEFAAQHPEWSGKRVCREFARLSGYPFWGVNARWRRLHGGRGGGGGSGAGAPPGAGEPGGSEGGARDIRAALLELARAPGRDGRLTAADLERVAGQFRVSYAYVLALWGQMWAAGEVEYPSRGDLLAELAAARRRIAELEAELRSVRAELEGAREARRRLEALLADLRRLVA